MWLAAARRVRRRATGGWRPRTTSIVLGCSVQTKAPETRYASHISLNFVRGNSLTDVVLQIVEICPFSQADLSPSDIYVLDAFFELYIVVGARSQRRVAAFGA